MEQLATTRKFLNDSGLESIKLTGLPYSGFFPGNGITDYNGGEDYITRWNEGTDLWTKNKSEASITYGKCFANEADPTRCTTSDVLLQYIEEPFFLVEESYDTYAIWTAHQDSEKEILGLKYAKDYENKAKAAIETLPSNAGYFMTSCVGHCWATGYTMEQISIDGTTLADAWSKWHSSDANEEVRIIEQCEKQWPPCNYYYSQGKCQWEEWGQEEPEDDFIEGVWESIESLFLQ